MFFKRLPTIIFRVFNDFGYLTDNRNFGYDTANKSRILRGERLLSKEGRIFFCALTEKPQTVEELATTIAMDFKDVSIKVIIEDANEFFLSLADDGFISKGETAEICDKDFPHFSYITSNNSNLNDFTEDDYLIDDQIAECFGKKPKLSSVQITIASICNERCTHCYIPHEAKTTIIDPKLFISILEQCNKLGVLNITISGGEPMLHPNLCLFLRKCKEYNFSVNLLTNLTLLNDAILNELILNPLISVQTSLYSMNPLVHDCITSRKFSFEKTKKGILKLWENNVPLQINCPILKQNQNTYSDVINWAHSLNIEAESDYNIIGKYNHETDNLACRLSIDEINNVLIDKAKDPTYIQTIRNQAEIRAKSVSKDPVCSICTHRLCISDKGSVYPCEGWQNCVLGDVRVSSLKDIWDNSQKIKKLRSICLEDFPTCIDCEERLYCEICMLRNANESHSGNPMEINSYFCEVAKIKHKIVERSL